MMVHVGVAQIAIGYLLGSLGACVVLLARDLDAARGELTWLSGGFGVALLVAGAAGPWLLRRGTGGVLRVASVVLAAGDVLLAFAPTLGLAQAGALLAGAGGAGIVLAVPALLAGAGAAARLSQVTGASMIAGVSAPLLISLVDALTGDGRLALLVPLPGLLWLAAGPTRVPGGAPPEPMSAPAPRVTAFLAGAWLSVVLAVSAEFAFVVWGAARLQDGGLGAAAAAACAAAFPIGMAAGRLVAPGRIATSPVVLHGVLVAIAGVLAVAAPIGAVLLTAALGVSGLGIALLYPVTIGRLVRTPGLSAHRGAALGAAASGTAALAAPVLLDLVAGSTSLRAGFLIVVPLLLALLLLHGPGRSGVSGVSGVGGAA